MLSVSIRGARPWRRAFFCAVALSGLVGLPAGAAAPRSTRPPSPCVEPVQEAEKHHGIPNGLLMAIAMVESGGRGRPSPLALNIEGRTHYPRNKDTALKLMHYGKGKLRQDMWVGCLQLSSRHHRRYFKSTEDMLDAAQNVRRGAAYLASHYRKYGSWTDAVARYHGSSEEFSQRYLCKVWGALIVRNERSAKLIGPEPCFS